MTPLLKEHRQGVFEAIRDIFHFQGARAAGQRVYFIKARTFTLVHGVQRTDATHIKIGISKDPPQRMRDLQGNTHAELSLLGATPLVAHADAIESMLHNRFSKSRVMGEWFSPTIQLYATVHDLCSRQEVWEALGIAA